MLQSNRWWIYQRERFPLLAHGSLVLAFSFSAVAYSSLLRESQGMPPFLTLAVAFLTSLAFFMQLRIADEFKDIEEDSRFRPYRPVPRGLIRLPELGWLGVALGLLQLGLAVTLYYPLVPLLLITWLYLALMSKEFFFREWLKARPIPYLLSHMLIMPLIDLYATACDWLLTSGSVPSGLYWFLIVSFCNGIVIEIGRKIRAPEDEEAGVNTYTALWGRPIAVGAWLGILALTATCAALAAQQIHFLTPVAILLGLLLLLAAGLGWHFLHYTKPTSGKGFELFSGLWTLCMYLSLGAAPLLWQA